MQCRSALITTFIALLGLGCSRVPPIDDGVVAYQIANRIDSEVEWRRGACQNEIVTNYIQFAIENELSANSAIQIALLNNPKIQVFFEEIGIARADLVEAGLFSNPAFEIEIRYPYVKGLKTNIEYLLTTSLLDIFLVPLRTKLASTEYEQAKLKVSNQILSLAFDVRETFYRLVAEREKIKSLQSIMELSDIANELSLKQLAVGNINTLEAQIANQDFWKRK